MTADRETPSPLETIDTRIAKKLATLRDSNSLTADDIEKIALVLTEENPECTILLFDHQKDNQGAVESLKDMGLKIQREKVNKYKEGQSANLKMILRVTKRG